MEQCLALPAELAESPSGACGDGLYDAHLRHLRRILCWLEVLDLGDGFLDHKLASLTEGLEASSSQGVRVGRLLDSMGPPLAREDAVQLMWWHLRRGELCVAQERVRGASGATEEAGAGRHGGTGSKQWWRASLIDPHGHLFEPSQRAAYSQGVVDDEVVLRQREPMPRLSAELMQVYSVKASGYRATDGQSVGGLSTVVSAAAAPGQERVTPSGWLMHRELCRRKALQSARSASAGPAAAFEAGLYAVLGGVDPLGPEAAAAALRDVLWRGGAFRQPEDQAWLALRALYSLHLAQRLGGAALTGDLMPDLRRSLDTLWLAADPPPLAPPRRPRRRPWSEACERPSSTS